MSLGWPEIVTILVIALIIFGPRKLPELSKSLGQSLAQFRKASDDFKRTWEDEVEAERRKLDISTSLEHNPLWQADKATTQLEEANLYSQAEAAEEAPATVQRDEIETSETKRDWM